jgi:hypothetical protein
MLPSTVGRWAGGGRPSFAPIADVFVRHANLTLGGGSATTARAMGASWRVFCDCEPAHL